MNAGKPKLNILGQRSTATLSRAAPISSQTETAGALAFEVEVVSDVICPWCWVGKRRLEKAIALLGPDAKAKVTWRPFQLNPSMAREGADRREYIQAKFGGIERFQKMEERLVEIGAAEGINFRFDRIARVPNTLDAHRLIWLAQRHGKQDAVVEGLFKAYFVDGVDVSERKILLHTAVAAGIEAATAGNFLASEDGLKEVVGEEQKFKAMGIDGVPGFVLNGAFLFSGAAEPQVMVEAFLHARTSP